MGFARHDFSAPELAEQLAAERRGRPFMLYRDGEGKQRLFELDRDRVSVGREADNDLALTWDSAASRVHALLERLAGSWTVVDDELSRNGTFVNGTRLRGRRRLNDRDVLRFGATEGLYRNPAGEGGETPQVSAHAAVAEISQAQRRVLVSLCRPLLEANQAAAPPSNREIAEELTVSVDAVRAHLKTLFRLFEVPDLHQNRKRAELARRALASGAVLPRDLTR